MQIAQRLALLALVVVSFVSTATQSSSAPVSDATKQAAPVKAPRRPTLVNPDPASQLYSLVWADHFTSITRSIGTAAAEQSTGVRSGRHPLWLAQEGKAPTGPAWISPSNVRITSSSTQPNDIAAAAASAASATTVEDDLYDQDDDVDESGSLRIDARKEAIKDNKGNFGTYTVGKVISRRMVGKGFYEVRLKVPTAAGLRVSVSVWTPSETSATTEINVIDIDTQIPTRPTAGVVVHTPEKQATSRMPGVDLIRLPAGSPDFSASFQTVGMEWRVGDDTVRYYVNGVLVSLQQWPKDAPAFTDGRVSLSISVPEWAIVDDAALVADKQEAVFDYFAYFEMKPQDPSLSNNNTVVEDNIPKPQVNIVANAAMDDAQIVLANARAALAEAEAKVAAANASTAAAAASNEKKAPPAQQPQHGTPIPVAASNTRMPSPPRQCAHCTGTHPINIYACPRQRFSPATNLLGGKSTNLSPHLASPRTKSGDVLLRAADSHPASAYASTFAADGRCMDASDIKVLEIIASKHAGTKFQVEVWDLLDDCRTRGEAITVEPTVAGTPFPSDPGYARHIVPIAGTKLNLKRLGGFIIKDIAPLGPGTTVILRCTALSTRMPGEEDKYVSVDEASRIDDSKVAAGASGSVPVNHMPKPTRRRRVSRSFGRLDL